MLFDWPVGSDFYQFANASGKILSARVSVSVNIGVYRSVNSFSDDFISCAVFGKGAEFAEKYLHKGTKIAITGRLETGSYTNKDGVKVYTTTVIVEEQEFAESKASSQNNAGGNYQQPASNNSSSGDGFMNVPDGIDEELPFV